VTFLRQLALLLPSAFLLGVLLFLLTHGRTDSGFGPMPFFEQWAGPAAADWTPEVRFLAQTSLLFLPVFAMTLFLVLAVTLAERAVFGKRDGGARSGYQQSFGSLFSLFFLLATPVLVLLTERLMSRRAPGAVVAPLIVALAPFVAGAAALIPSAVLAAPVAALRRMVAR